MVRVLDQRCLSPKQSDPSVEDIAALFCKVTSCYTEGMYGNMKKAMEDTIGGRQGGTYGT